MSKYTTELRYICEKFANVLESKGDDDVNEIIESARKHIFSFDYPIFDESYRRSLETKVLRHFYLREIGFETFGLWKFHLENMMKEIMPYYNQLYKSELFDFNPFYDVDVTRDSKTTDNNVESKTDSSTTASSGVVENTGKDKEEAVLESSDTSTASTTSATANSSEAKSSTTDVTNRESLDKYSDTPQGSVDNVKNGTYLTNARQVADDTVIDHTSTTTDSSSGSNSSESKGTVTGAQTNNVSRETSNTTKDTKSATITSDMSATAKNLSEYIEHVKGKNGGQSYSSLLKEFRETFLNIDMAIIHDLEGLFFQLW